MLFLQRTWNRTPVPLRAPLPFQVVALTIIGAVLFIALADCSGNSSGDDVTTRNDSFGVSGISTLYVDLFRGPITIIGNSPGQLAVHAVIHDPALVTYRAQRVFDSIEVSASAQSISRVDSQFVELRIDAPPGMRLVLKTTGGEVEVNHFTAGAEISTSNGAVTVNGMRGDLVATTSNAPVTIFGLDGSVTVDTTAAEIALQGRLASDTHSFVATSGAAVKIDLDDNEGISDNPSVQFDAQATGGSVSVAYAVKPTMSQTGHRIGTIGGGRASLTVRTSGDSIDIY